MPASPKYERIVSSLQKDGKAPTQIVLLGFVFTLGKDRNS
jgi:hypothetical protein